MRRSCVGSMDAPTLELSRCIAVCAVTRPSVGAAEAALWTPPGGLPPPHWPPRTVAQPRRGPKFRNRRPFWTEDANSHASKRVWGGAARPDPGRASSAGAAEAALWTPSGGLPPLHWPPVMNHPLHTAFLLHFKHGSYANGWIRWSSHRCVELRQCCLQTAHDLGERTSARAS